MRQFIETWFIKSDRQTKYLILMLLIYMTALIWTTLQSFARLEYSRSDAPPTPIIISNENP